MLVLNCGLRIIDEIGAFTGRNAATINGGSAIAKSGMISDLINGIICVYFIIDVCLDH